MRRALDSQRMFEPWRVRPSGLEARVLRIVTRQCEFELPRRFSRMGPDRGGLVWRLYRFTHYVEQAKSMPVELNENFSDVIDVPGDRMEMLAEAFVKFRDRLVRRVALLRGHHRLHDHVADR